MEDGQLRELIRNSFSFLMNYGHPREQIVKGLIEYLRDVRKVSGENGDLESLAGRIAFKFTYGGYLIEDKIQFAPTTRIKYKFVSYKLKEGFNFDEVVDEFFEALREKEAVLKS